MQDNSTPSRDTLSTEPDRANNTAWLEWRNGQRGECVCEMDSPFEDHGYDCPFEVWERAYKAAKAAKPVPVAVTCQHGICRMQYATQRLNPKDKTPFRCTYSKKELNEEKRVEVEALELDVKKAEIERRAKRLLSYDDAPISAGTTLDDLTASFEDDVDLSPTPAILDRRHGDGGLVMPAGKLSWLYGLPSSGKSFVGAMGASEAVLRGGRVMFLDYEDNKKTFQQRAAILGLNPKDHADSFRYIHGGLADSPLAMAQAEDWLSQADDMEMSLVVIDAAESSGCPSDGAPVNEWLAKVVQPWERLGVTVIIIDHIPKQREGRPDGPIGSQRKLAAVTGIALKLTGNCWSKTKNGRLVLTCEKDRTGNYAKGEKVAAIVGEWDTAGHSRIFGYRILNPAQSDEDSGNIGSAILEYVAEAMPEGISSKRDIRANVKGKAADIGNTIDNLVEGGLLVMSALGKGNNYTITGTGKELLS